MKDFLRRMLAAQRKLDKDPGNLRARGYITGGLVYNDYPTWDDEGRKASDRVVKSMSEGARDGNDPLAEGFMAGMRDAANDRKARVKSKFKRPF